jgi:hypothetical protein
MRFSILVTAVAVASSDLIHAGRIHHIYQSCKALPQWKWSYKAAMDLLQLTVNLLDVAGAAQVPEDLLRVIDDLAPPPKHDQYPLIRPGSVEWATIIGTYNSLVNCVVVLTPLPDPFKEMFSWTLSQNADNDDFFLVAPTEIRSACDNTPCKFTNIAVDRS